MRILYFLIGTLLILGLWACQPSNSTPDPKPKEVILTFNAENPIEWILEDVQGATDAGTIGGKNTSLTLNLGTRYTIVNKGGASHPFQLLDSTIILLSEYSAGNFANDPDVNFEETSDGFSFTLSQELANVLDSYNCAFHSSMTGSITVNSNE